MTTYRPAAVERVDADTHTVVGVGRGREPMVVPTISMVIRRVWMMISRRKRRKWRVEIGGETYVYAASLRQARVDASARAFALDEVPPTDARVTPVDPEWPVVARAYVAGVFRGVFLDAVVRVDAVGERWTVTLTRHGLPEVWTREIESDDDEFIFECGDRQVVFPIPESL